MDQLVRLEVPCILAAEVLGIVLGRIAYSCAEPDRILGACFGIAREMLGKHRRLNKKARRPGKEALFDQWVARNHEAIDEALHIGREQPEARKATNE